MKKTTTKSCCHVTSIKTAPINTQAVSFAPSAIKPLLGQQVMIPQGSFLMGCHRDEGYVADGEGPVREVSIDAFYMDAITVTNGDFQKFVHDTGYITDAEKYGWSFVFYQLLTPTGRQAIQQVAPETPWWAAVKGACWKHPEGPGSAILTRMNHPVVHVSWHDAQAFCRWAGKALPTEAQWEYAARGGLVQQRFPWGDELTPNGQHMCNIWQGKFPVENTQLDGYIATAPAKSFPPNGYGLYNMVGNVWEWCEDWFTTAISAKPQHEPTGPTTGAFRVMRGGSYLCHASYCNRYRVAARSKNSMESSSGNIGFRCVTPIQTN